jgi:hypothetical protein
MSGGECQTKNRSDPEDEKDDKPIKALDEGKLLPYGGNILCLF